MAEGPQQVVVVAAWPGDATPSPIARLADGGWRVEPVLPDQSALDRAGSRGRTPPPFQTLLWHPLEPQRRLGGAVPEAVRTVATQWAALRTQSYPAWDDTGDWDRSPEIKQVSFLKPQPDLTPAEFTRHYREHVAVAREHHPAIVRYAQHDVLETTGGALGDIQGVSELWFASSAALVEGYFAGPDSVAVVRADNREYIDFSGTLSLVVQPVDVAGVAA